MYALYQPAPELHPYIESCWIVDTTLSAAMPLRELIFVDGKADIIFNYGDAYQRQSFETQSQDILQQNSNVDAPRHSPVQIQQSGRIQLVGIRFRPGGLSAFTNVPANDVANHILQPELIFGKAACDLEYQLYDHFGNAAGQVALVNRFFLDRLKLRESFQYALCAATMIQGQQGQVDLKDIAHETGYSTRSLNRFFNQHYGFSLKFYTRIARFQAAQRRLWQDMSLVEIALDCGFYDQSHFIHEFQAFAGSAPGAYREMIKARTETPPNLVQFLQDSPD